MSEKKLSERLAEFSSALRTGTISTTDKRTWIDAVRALEAELAELKALSAEQCEWANARDEEISALRQERDIAASERDAFAKAMCSDGLVRRLNACDEARAKAEAERDVALKNIENVRHNARQKALHDAWLAVNDVDLRETAAHCAAVRALLDSES